MSSLGNTDYLAFGLINIKVEVDEDQSGREIMKTDSVQLPTEGNMKKNRVRLAKIGKIKKERTQLTKEGKRKKDLAQLRKEGKTKKDVVQLTKEIKGKKDFVQTTKEGLKKKGLVRLTKEGKGKKDLVQSKKEGLRKPHFVPPTKEGLRKEGLAQLSKEGKGNKGRVQPAKVVKKEKVCVQLTKEGNKKKAPAQLTKEGKINKGPRVQLTKETRGKKPQIEEVGEFVSSTLVHNMPVIGTSASFPQTLNTFRSCEERRENAHEFFQGLAHQIRNVLKLPKAHRWVQYEFFYSNIDRVLFGGENDFQICLRESFPQLKPQNLTRVQWCQIRRLMGKPRRCSPKFFDEERESLALRRQKIRLIQQRKVTEFCYRELPEEIPLQLVIGSKVTARVRKPQDGFFIGTVQGLDTSDNTYRVSFLRQGVGTHSIPDYEVVSVDPPETMSTSSYAMQVSRKGYCKISGGFPPHNATFTGGDGPLQNLPKSAFPVYGMLGGFPIQLLDTIVRFSKVIKVKREKISVLRELNAEGEKLRAYSKPLNDDYRIKFARCTLDLESINKEVNLYSVAIQQFFHEVFPEQISQQMVVPEHVQSECQQEADYLVESHNLKKGKYRVCNSRCLALITNLASMMFQVKELSRGDKHLYELNGIKTTLKDIKASLLGTNVQLFQNLIEIPMNRIQAGLCAPPWKTH